jgi:hypothetical protein
MGSKTGTERSGSQWSCAARVAVTAGHRPDVSSVMACWHWNRQPTQPPDAARWRRVAMTMVKASTAATAVPTVAAMTATTVAASPNR